MLVNKIRVRVGGGRDYDILVGFGILGQLGRRIRRLGLRGKAFVITSPAIGKLYLRDLLKALNRGGYRDIRVAYLPDGEKNKSFASYRRIMRQAVGFCASEDEKLFVVNLGGGVVGDLGGFVAATYRRGVDYVQVPTTLLAFVDCGIGGKTAVNLDGIKNTVGAFHQPRLVHADLDLLKTLSKREVRSALAEVVKHGVIRSPGLFDLVESHVDKVFSLNREVMTQVVLTNYRIKADIVRRDEFETKGIRTVLNYGHTIGHAVESASRYAYRHGEAVSIGMVCANDIAVELAMLDRSVAARIENLLIRIGLPVRIKNHDLARIMHFFWMDKKFVNGKNRFVLATGIGKTRIREGVPLRLVERVVRNRFTTS
ncbi:MAG: 3-dehydroquinate synthase [Candidatus Coatesbacteria bacterium]